MQHPHHTPYALALLPFLLLPIAVGFPRLQMGREQAHYRAIAAEAAQELERLDVQLRSAERSYTLLTQGREEVFSPSQFMEYLERRFDSAFTEYASLEEHLRNAREAMAVLSARLAVHGTKIIHVDLSEQMATLIDRGTVIARYPVSSGAADTPTPTGTFSIHRKQHLRISSLETPYRMPNYMAFTPNESHGLHALPYLGDTATNSDYWHEARSHIGIPVSHGCVRLLPEHAKQLFEWVEVGTRVEIST